MSVVEQSPQEIINIGYEQRSRHIGHTILGNHEYHGVVSDIASFARTAMHGIRNLLRTSRQPEFIDLEMYWDDQEDVD